MNSIRNNKNKLEEDIIIPYNINNVIISGENIKQLFSKFNFKVNIKNINYYIEGTTHKSYTKKEYEYKTIERDENDSLELFEKSYERLEFLGDTIIKCIAAEYLFDRYEDQDEGFMTRLKTKIEDKDSLAKYAKRLGLDQYMIISRQIEEKEGRNAPKLLEDCFESFIGALYKDLGFQICKDFIIYLLETEIDYSEILYKDTNYKDQLLRFYHKNRWSHPEYIVKNVSGAQHCRTYTIGILDYDKNLIEDCLTTDNSKKRAEQMCAMKVLFKYHQIAKDQLVDIESIQN